MLAINYDPIWGKAFSDKEAKATVLALIKSAESNGEVQSLDCSTSNIVLATRALIASGKIKHTSISFWFGGAELEVDKDGRMLVWPRGFCDYEDDRLMAIVKGRD